MSDKIRRYEGKEITVGYDARRCIHFAECVRGLPSVFDQDGKPWVNPDGDEATRVAATVMRCPTGALSFEHRDGTSEPVPEHNIATVTANGPILLHGDVRIHLPGAAEPQREVRVALCRCGASANKPFCDGQHDAAGFTDAGALPPRDSQPVQSNADGLTLRPAPNGPILFQGPLEIRGEDGSSVTMNKGALCRCGHSATKPLCDGSHREHEFKA